MTKNKVASHVKNGLIVLACLLAGAVLLHLTVNYLVPFIASMHNNGNVY